MRERPLSISVIGWLFLLMAIIMVCGLLISIVNPAYRERLLALNHLSLHTQYSMLIISAVISGVAGMGVLRQQGWARWVYLFWSIIGFAVYSLTGAFEPDMVPGMLLAIVIIVFLFAPGANRYYRELRHNVNMKENPNKASQVTARKLTEPER